LGWLNATLQLESAEPFDGNGLLLLLAREIQIRLKVHDAEIAHLKMTLAPDEEGNDLAVANLVRGDAKTELSHWLQEPLESGQLILNLRAEADPEFCRAAVLDSIEAIAATARLMFHLEHIEHFRPGKPTPTHRLTGI
jgi:hypothetical protein